MDFELGIVCGRCDRFSPIGTQHCVCGNDLSLVRVPSLSSNAIRKISAPDITGASIETACRSQNMIGSRYTREAQRERLAKHYSHLSQEQLMEQARNYVCTSCSSPVPIGHKFCGRCGTGVPEEIMEIRTLYFSDMQNPSKAKLVLIRGEGAEGVSYHLRANNHVAGKQGDLQFFDDPFISERHADFYYRDNKLVVQDLGSLNGVYIRIRDTVTLNIGDTFLAGEQVFRVDPNDVTDDAPEVDGTEFYASPRYAGPFRITQVFEGGCDGMVVCARSSSIQIGREGGDLNFPGDPYMSGIHCSVDYVNGEITLTDLHSRNGTYVRIKGEHELVPGDYVFIGRKLLRVEMNTN